MTNKEITEQYKAAHYDVEQMIMDNDNGNFDPQDHHAYGKAQIVITSIINGQHTQAKEQAEEYGLPYEWCRGMARMKTKVKLDRRATADGGHQYQNAVIRELQAQGRLTHAVTKKGQRTLTLEQVIESQQIASTMSGPIRGNTVDVGIIDDFDTFDDTTKP